jgi:hypothetical protein
MIDKISYLFFVFIFFGLSSMAFAGQYTAQKSGFTIQVPKGWKLDQTSEGRNLIKGAISPRDDHETGLQVRVYKSGNTSYPEEWIDNYIKDYIRQLEGHWQGSKMELVELTKAYTGKYDHYIAVFNYYKKDGNFFIKQFIFPRTRDYLVIQAGIPEQKRFKYENVIDNVVSSMELHQP